MRSDAIDTLLGKLLFWSVILNIVAVVVFARWIHEDRTTAPALREAQQVTRRAEARYDTARAERLPALISYRTLRDTVDITDTVMVREVIARADTVMAKDSSALAEADSVIAAKDKEITLLTRMTKPRRVTPWAEALWNPYSKEYRARGGLDVRVVKNLHAVVAGEATRDGPAALVGVRVVF